MPNRMYQQFGGQNNMIDRINQFKKTLTGDPEEQLKNLINSGNVPQGVLNQAQQMAKPIYELMKSLK